MTGKAFHHKTGIFPCCGSWFRQKGIVIVWTALIMLFRSVSWSSDLISIERIRLDKKPYRMSITFSGKPSYKIIQSDHNEVLIAFRNVEISRHLKTSGDAKPFIESISLERAPSDVVSFVINTKTRLRNVKPAWDHSRKTLVITLNEPSKDSKKIEEKKKKAPVASPKDSESVKEKQSEKKEEPLVADKPEKPESPDEIGKPVKTKFNGVMDDLLIELKDDPCGKREVIAEAIQDGENKLWEKASHALTAYLEGESEIPCREQALILKAFVFFKAIPEEGESDLYLEAAEHFQNLISFYPDSIYIPYALTGLGKINRLIKNIIEAKGYFKMVYENHKDYHGMPEVILELGEIYNTTGQSKQAIILFKEAAKRFSFTNVMIGINIELGKAYYNTKNYVETIAVLKEVVTADPKIIYEKPDILILMGNSYYSMGKTAEAREYLGMVYNLFPDTELNHEYLTKIGDTYREEKEEEKAIEIYRLVIEKYPGTSGFVISTMRLADLSKDPSEKEKLYQVIINGFPEHELYRFAIMKLAELYDKNGDHLKSIEALKKILNENVGSLRKDALELLEKTTISLFRNYLESEQQAALLTHFETDKEILNKFKDPELFNLVGTGYLRAHLPVPALEYLKKAYDLYGKGKKSADLTMELGIAFQENGKIKEALDMFNIFVALFNDSGEVSKAYYRRGLIFSDMKKQDKAIESFRLAFEKSGNNDEKVRILIAEANSHKTLENYKVVALLLEKAIQILAGGPYDDFKTIFTIHRNLGETYMKLKEYVKASDAFIMAMKFADKEKNNADVMFMLGDSYQKSDALMKAAAMFEEVKKTGDAFWGRLADERLKEITVSGNLENT